MLRYAITHRARFPGDEVERQAALLQQAGRLAAAGVDFIQLREKDLEAGALTNLARKLLAILHPHHPAPKLLINSRADIAIATAADGVHLTSALGSLTPSQVRDLYAAANLPEPIVSVSCHSLAEVIRARDSSATLILFGPVFQKAVFEIAVLDTPAPHATEALISNGIGLDLLHAACAAAVPTPVLALGGITAANTEQCLAAGAAGVAAIRLFLGEPATPPSNVKI